MKKEVARIGIFSFFLISFMNLVSAQFYRSYGRFSFTDLINALDPETVIFVILFGIFFAVLHLWILGRFFRGHQTVSWVVSLLVSFGMTYGIYINGWINVNNLLFGLGLPSDILWPAIVVVLSIFIILLLWKFKYTGVLILGALFILLGLTDLVYEGGASLIIGIVLMILGFIWRGISKKKRAWFDAEIEKTKGPSWFIFGILLLVAGTLTGIGWVLIGGLLIIILSVFFWKRSKDRARNYLKQGGHWAKRKGVEGAQALGRGTVGRTSLTKGRLMSKKRAEEAAYKEKAHRESKARRKWAKASKKLQKQYDKQKAIYSNQNLPIPTRKVASAEMQKIVSYANSNGLHLRL